MLTPNLFFVKIAHQNTFNNIHWKAQRNFQISIVRF